MAFCLSVFVNLFTQAEAIKKILGQDSSRKKREDKNKKRQEELAQVPTTVTTIIYSFSVWFFLFNKIER